MSQPVKLSDALVLEARVAAEAQQRSIAGQVEYWAKLGRSVEELLAVRELRVLRAGAQQASLTHLVESIDKPEGRARLKAYLDSEPYPHFEPHPTRKGLLVRIEADGRRNTGRFVNRQFVESKVEKRVPVKARVRGRAEARLAKAVGA
jgi:ParD-like antitoxin of type II bacterial toxin-antitoxin system